MNVLVESVDGSDEEDDDGDYYTAKASKKKEKKRQEREAQRQVSSHLVISYSYFSSFTIPFI